jgi:integrase
MKDGKLHEERVGREIKDGMTAKKAQLLRLKKIEGEEQTKREIREDRTATTWTFSNLFEEYRASAAARGVKALGQDVGRFNKYLKDAFGKKTPSEVVPLDVERVKRKLAKSISEGTIQNVFELLTRLSGFATEMQLTEGLRFKIKRPKLNNSKTECLTAEQIQDLIKACDADENRKVAAVVKMALFSGMRKMEILRLKWDHVSFEHGSILIENPKGGQDQQIPLNDLARQVLEMEVPNFGSDYIFPGPDGGHLKSAKGAINRIKKNAGLPKDFRPMHGLRHTFASWLASSGKVSLYELQHLLTHKCPTMTQRYAHLRDEALHRAGNVASEVFAKAV